VSREWLALPKSVFLNILEIVNVNRFTLKYGATSRISLADGQEIWSRVRSK
jgi:hypothetical protein